MSRAVDTPWKPGDDRDLAFGQRLADAVAAHLDDLGLAVLGVGEDPGLAAGEAHRGLAEVLDRHREQRHRDALTGGEQHVHLAATGVARDVARQPHEIVGRLAHGRDHGDDVVARTARSDDVIGHGPDAIRVGDRGPAELLNQETHGRQGYRRSPRATDGFRRPVHSAAVPTADKRQRKKENARLAREAREAAVKRRRRNRTIRNGAIAVAVFVIVVLGILTLVDHKSSKKKVAVSPTTTTTTFKVSPTKTYTANITTNFGTIVLALDAKHDPIGAGRFITLAKNGVYNGSRWHRIVKDFVIQGGAPGGDPSKSVGNPVVGEPRRTTTPSVRSQPRRPARIPRGRSTRSSSS